MIFAASELTPLLPVLLALLGGGGLAWYTAKPKREGMIAEASERAVSVVKEAIDRLEHELQESRQRIAVLEERLKHAQEDREKIEQEMKELTQRVAVLREQLIRAGHDPGPLTPAETQASTRPPELPGGQGKQ